jgi:hypothetical protein
LYTISVVFKSLLIPIFLRKELSLMRGPSLEVLRIGKKYRLKNFGESHEFEVEARLGSQDYKVKDLLTLERYRLIELISYGKGNDFEVEEI